MSDSGMQGNGIYKRKRYIETQMPKVWVRLQSTAPGKAINLKES